MHISLHFVCVLFGALVIGTSRRNLLRTYHLGGRTAELQRASFFRSSPVCFSPAAADRRGFSIFLV